MLIFVLKYKYFLRIFGVHFRFELISTTAPLNSKKVVLTLKSEARNPKRESGRP